MDRCRRLRAHGTNVDPTARPDIVAIVALSAQFMMTNVLNNVAQTTADFPALRPEAQSS